MQYSCSYRNQYRYHWHQLRCSDLWNKFYDALGVRFIITWYLQDSYCGFLITKAKMVNSSRNRQYVSRFKTKRQDPNLCHLLYNKLATSGWASRFKRLCCTYYVHWEAVAETTVTCMHKPTIIDIGWFFRSVWEGPHLFSFGSWKLS